MKKNLLKKADEVIRNLDNTTNKLTQEIFSIVFQKGKREGYNYYLNIGEYEDKKEVKIFTGSYGIRIEYENDGLEYICSLKRIAELYECLGNLGY